MRFLNKIFRWFGLETLEVGHPFAGYPASATTTYRVQLSMPHQGNKEVNFRAWDKRTKKMHPVRSIILNGQQYAEDKLPAPFQIVYPQVQAYYLEQDKGHPKASPTDKSFFLIDFELMQFTGFQDKNGVDIYVGDILGSEAGRTEVVQRNGSFQCKRASSHSLLSDIEPARTEVVGNIFEGVLGGKSR